MFTPHSRVNLSSRLRAFTLVELIVALVISSILILVTVKTYTLFRKGVTQDQSRSQLSQNGRVAMDRLTRELRITPDLVTLFPDNPTDPTPPEPHEVEFENGYVAPTDVDYLTYHRYYLSGTTLEMDIKQYYLASNPGSRVHWNTIDTNGSAAISQVLSTQAIAQGLSLFSLYGRKPLQVFITTSDNLGQLYPLRSYVTPRNL